MRWKTIKKVLSFDVYAPAGVGPLIHDSRPEERPRFKTMLGLKVVVGDERRAAQIRSASWSLASALAATLLRHVQLLAHAESFLIAVNTGQHDHDTRFRGRDICCRQRPERSTVG